MLQHHMQNLKLSVGVKQMHSCEDQEPLYTQCSILFPKWKITVLRVETGTEKKKEKKPKQNQTKYKTKPQIYGSKPSAGASSPFTTV